MSSFMSAGATRGVLYVHSAPAALCSHVEWAVSAALSARVSLNWSAQLASPGTLRAEADWTGELGTASRITSALRQWQLLRFEVTEDGSTAGEGLRFMCSPTLGMFAATTNVHGDVLVSENRLRAAQEAALRGEGTLSQGIDALLGTAWDAELEVYRRAGDGAPQRWLHQVG